MASYEFLDHTGEMVLLVRAPGLDQLFAEAARALGELEREGIPAAGQTDSCRVTLEAGDLPALLIDWLNELIYLSETMAAVPARATVHLAEPARLNAEVELARLERRPALVKAATLHRLRLEPEPGGWVAEVILDV
jgi:SHS2 domain-containing protein